MFCFAFFVHTFIIQFTDNIMVPWTYNCNYVNETVSTSISGIRGMTQSERCYVPAMDKMAPPKPIKERLPKQKEPKIVLDMIKKLVTKKEALEFLKFIKHSEYSVIEELNKLLARIPLLALLLNSEPHRNALMKVLCEAYVAHNISVEKVDQLVSNIVVRNMIAFSDDEISSERHGSTKALHQDQLEGVHTAESFT